MKIKDDRSEMNQKELQHYVEKVSLEYFGQPFLHVATWNNRLRTTGGRYHTQSHDLDFNKKVWETFGEETFLGIVKHNVDTVAIGNGTASRESEQFVADNLREIGKRVGKRVKKLFFVTLLLRSE
jgi:transcriptional accessory protein Tex/SPT6